MAQKETILAIYDNLQHINNFRSFLVPKYNLRIAKSSLEAISSLNGNTPDIILLDIEMQNISAFEFIKNIQKIPFYCEIPIIIAGCSASLEFFEKAEKSSVYDVLTKPIKPECLIQTIEKALAKTGIQSIMDRLGCSFEEVALRT